MRIVCEDDSGWEYSIYKSPHCGHFENMMFDVVFFINFIEMPSIIFALICNITWKMYDVSSSSLLNEALFIDTIKTSRPIFQHHS